MMMNTVFKSVSRSLNTIPSSLPCSPFLSPATRFTSAALVGQCRLKSASASSSTSSAPEMCNKFLTLGKKDTFQKNWLSDPSTYPVISALTFAVFLCAGVGFSCLAYSPDVRIATEKKRATIRDWGL